MKIIYLFLLLFTNIIFSQTIEEKKDGDFLIKNYLNNDLEIIKIEKIKESKIIESYEYLPGGQIKNGKFFDNIVGWGVYENGKIKEGQIFYNTAISKIPEIYFYGNLKISDFKIKGEVQLFYDFRKKPNLTENEKKAKTLAVLNFDENGLLDGKQFYNDINYKYYMEYKNGNPIKYVKKENKTLIDSISFNPDITKNVTFLLNTNVYNRQQPRLIFNPFNFFIRLNDECYNNTKEYESTYENIINTGYSNDLKQISLNYYTKIDCDNRKVILDGINVIFDLKEVDFIDKISKSDYSFLPIRLQNQVPKNDITSIEYLFISEMLLGRSNYTFLENDLDSPAKGKKYDNYNYLLHYFITSTDSEHSILSNLLFNLTTTGFHIDYGQVKYDTRQKYSESITENINLFKNINYYSNSDLFYKINLENSDLTEIKKITDLKERHNRVYNYFNTLSKLILDKIPADLIVLNEDETEEVNLANEKNEKFHHLKKGKPNKEEIITFLKTVSNDSLITTEKR